MRNTPSRSRLVALWTIAALALLLPAAHAGAAPRAAAAARATGKPTVKRFYRAFVSAVRSVNPNTGRIAPSALARLESAQAAMTGAMVDIRLSPQRRVATHELLLAREITGRVSGHRKILESEVEALADAFTALGVVDPGSAEHRQLARAMRAVAVPAVNVPVRSLEYDVDLSKATPRRVRFPVAARVVLQRPHDGAGPIIVELDPSRVTIDPTSVLAWVDREPVKVDPSKVRVTRGTLQVDAPAGTRELTVQNRTRAVTIQQGESGFLRSDDLKSFASLTWPSELGQIGPAVTSPDDKVRVTFNVKPPPGAVVMDNNSRRGGPAYNGAFVVLDGYEKVTAQAHNGLPIELWRRPGTTTPETEQAMLDAVVKHVAFLERTLGKLPPMPHGVLRYVEGLYDGFSMEHDGLIAMAPGSLSNPKDAAEIAIHELSHHLFGNTIREKNWDFWMNEGFANYWEYRGIEEIWGPARARARWDRAAALANRSLSAGQHPLVNPRGTDVLTVFDQVPYNYGAWMLRMMEHQLGRAEFDGIMKDYVAHYLGKRAGTLDFARFFTRRNSKKIDFVAYFNQWNALTQVPRVRMEELRFDDGARTLRMGILPTTKVPAGLTIPVRITFESGARRILQVDVSKRDAAFEHRFTAPVAKVEFDPDRTTLVEVDQRGSN